MPVTTLTRTPANTKYGHHVNLFTIDGGEQVAHFTNVGLALDVETQQARSVLDSWDTNRVSRKGATLDFSRVVESTLPLMALAAGNAYFLAVIQHAASGVSYTGAFQITRCRWEAGDGPQSESCTAVSQGALTPGVATAAVATPRATAASTKFGHHVAKIALSQAGNGNDYVNLFTNIGVDIEIDTAEGNAVLDAWKYPFALARRVTVDLGKVVETTLPLMALGIAATQLSAAIDGVIWIGNGAGDYAISGQFVPTNTRWNAPDGAQEESIALVSTGAVTVTTNGV